MFQPRVYCRRQTLSLRVPIHEVKPGTYRLGGADVLVRNEAKRQNQRELRPRRGRGRPRPRQVSGNTTAG